MPPRTMSLEQTLGLEALSRALLLAPPGSDLSQLLLEHVPDILPGCWLEVRLLPNQTLYFQGQNWSPLLDDVWQQLETLSAPYLALQEPPLAFRQVLPGSALLVPIQRVADDQIVGGVFASLADTGREPEATIPLLQILAAQIAAALHRDEQFARTVATITETHRQEIYEEIYRQTYHSQLEVEFEKLKQELALARTIQLSFLPRTIPQIPGWQLTATLEPARETSGDFYDIIQLPNGHIGLLVADVADKGIGPALYMAVSRTLIRTYALHHDSDPGRVMTLANERLLAETDSDLFVTIFYAILNPATGDLAYCNAGHNPPYLFATSPDQQTAEPVVALKGTGIPLGLFDHLPWHNGSAHLEPGATLLLYSDGIVEAQDEDGNFYGSEMLQAVVDANRQRSAMALENRVMSSLYRFVGDAPQADDITLMILRRDTA